MPPTSTPAPSSRRAACRRAADAITRLLLTLAIAVPCHAEDPAVASPARRASIERLRDHVGFLASDDLGGRDSGEPGLEVAADYIARQFRRIGLEPAGDNGTYFHHFAVPGGARFSGAPEVEVEAGGVTTRWRAGADVEAFGYGGGPVDAPIVFVGYGIQVRDEDLDYDDYRGVDVSGKVVLMLRYSPRRGRSDVPSALAGRRGRRVAAFQTKLTKARERGAVGAMIVTPPGAEEESLYGVAHRAAPGGKTLPTVFARRDAVARLLAMAGRDLAAEHAAIDEELEPASFELEGSRVRFATERRYYRLRNVVGRLPGADEKLAHEAVVVGGHYDHIGRFGGQVASKHLGQVHNGADDNASGVAGFIEVAELLAASPPRRSVLFMGFSGEEIGLTGSRAWVEAPRLFAVERDLRLRKSPAEDAEEGLEVAGGAVVSTTTQRRGRVWVQVRVRDGATGWVKPDDLKQIAGPYPIHDIVTMVNLDMIGRAGEDSRVSVLAANSSRGFPELVERLGKEFDVPVTVPRGQGFGGSDHMNFQSRQIPVLFFNTGLPRGIYNTPVDDTETINFEAQTRIVDLITASTLHVANGDKAPAFDDSFLAGGRRARGPRLGVFIDQEYEGPGARIERCVDDSVAAKAGLMEGDTILSFAGKSIDDLPSLVRSIRQSGKGKVKIRIARGDEKLDVEAVFPEG